MIKRRFRLRQTGSSMMEVLVTMVVVAVGLLGQAALMAQSSKSSTTALMRSQATLLAYDILERMRLNQSLALFDGFNSATATSCHSGCPYSQTELLNWQGSVANMLPAGAGVVSTNCSGVSPCMVTIAITWSEVTQGIDTGGATNSTTFTTQSIL